MWIMRLVLSRSYTFVMAPMIAELCAVAIHRITDYASSSRKAAGGVRQRRSIDGAFGA